MLYDMSRYTLNKNKVCLYGENGNFLIENNNVKKHIKKLYNTLLTKFCLRIFRLFKHSHAFTFTFSVHLRLFLH